MAKIEKIEKIENSYIEFYLIIKPFLFSFYFTKEDLFNNVVSLDIVGLHAGTKYYYGIKAFDRAGNYQIKDGFSFQTAGEEELLVLESSGSGSGNGGWWWLSSPFPQEEVVSDDKLID